MPRPTQYLVCVYLLAILVLGSLGCSSPVPARERLFGSATTLPQGIHPFEPGAIHFVPNLGQLDPLVRYTVKTNRESIYFLKSEVWIALAGPVDLARDSGSRGPELRLSFHESNRTVQILGGSLMPARFNYCLGEDPSQWQTAVPSYASVVYREIYDHVDVTFSGTKGMLESIYTVKRGGDVDTISVALDGARWLRLDEEGNLVIETARGQLLETKPLAFQQTDQGRREVACRFTLDPVAKRYGFALDGPYDPEYALVIDPIIGFSSYLGGAASDSVAASAVNAKGELYLAGQTFSTDFPVESSLFPNPAGKGDTFVSKLSADGTTLLYSTYLGGSEFDSASSIFVDENSGEVFLAGWTFSQNFPLVSPIRNMNSGGGDGFIAQISTDGDSVNYATYLGGNDFDVITGIDVDVGGSIHVAGQTSSIDFPLQSALQPVLRGVSDAFVTRLAAGGQSLRYSTYLGGSDLDGAQAVEIDAAGRAYVTGFTSSLNFPTFNPFQERLAGNTDAFVLGLSADGSGFVFATYLGGSDDDTANALVVDNMGTAHVTGRTRSADFPVTANAFQSSNNGRLDAFLTSFSSAAPAVTRSTYLGGSGDDEANAISVDSNGDCYLAGSTTSVDFPVANAIQASAFGLTDVFVTRFSSGGQTLIFSTYLGGTSDDTALGLSVDAMGNIYLSGETRSTDFPIVEPVQTAFGGGATDGFFVRIDPFEPEFTSTLFFPRLVTTESVNNSLDTSEFTGIAVANLSNTDGFLGFTAFHADGSLISGPGVANPVLKNLAAKNQLAMIDSEVFGSGLTVLNPRGWFSVQSTVAETVGFFLVFNSTLSVLDGATVSSDRVTDFVLPEVEHEGFTQVHVANPDESSTLVTLDLVAGDGSVQATAARSLAPNGAIVEALSSLYPGTEVFSSDMHVRGSADNPVVAFEYLGKVGEFVEGVNGQDVTKGTKIIYSPQYVVGGPWRSTVTVINFTNVDATLLFRFIGDDGNTLGTRIMGLDKGGKVFIDAQDFLVVPDPENLIQGYLEITSDTAEIGGSVVFGDPNRTTFAAVLPLVATLTTNAVFSQVASNGTFFTGLAVLNPTMTASSFLLEVFDSSGNLIQSTTVQLGGKERTSRLLTEYLPNLPSMSAGYFRITSATGLLSFALFGTTNLSVLSAVPAQQVP